MWQACVFDMCLIGMFQKCVRYVLDMLAMGIGAGDTVRVPMLSHQHKRHLQ